MQRYNLFKYSAVYARFVYDTKVFHALKRRIRRDMIGERGRFRNFSLTFHRNFRKGNAAKDTLSVVYHITESVLRNNQRADRPE